jgi:hypothetical protein
MVKRVPSPSQTLEANLDVIVGLKWSQTFQPHSAEQQSP